MRSAMAVLAQANTRLNELRRLGDFDAHAPAMREAFDLIVGLAEILNAMEARQQSDTHGVTPPMSR